MKPFSAAQKPLSCCIELPTHWADTLSTNARGMISSLASRRMAFAVSTVSIVVDILHPAKIPCADLYHTERDP
eukprot:5586422-Pyramimonas_sp.AAC.1